MFLIYIYTYLSEAESGSQIVWNVGEDIAEKGQSFFFLDKSQGVDEALEKLLRSPQGIESEVVEVEPATWRLFESVYSLNFDRDPLNSIFSHSFSLTVR